MLINRYCVPSDPPSSSRRLPSPRDVYSVRKIIIKKSPGQTSSSRAKTDVMEFGKSGRTCITIIIILLIIIIITALYFPIYRRPNVIAPMHLNRSFHFDKYYLTFPFPHEFHAYKP